MKSRASAADDKDETGSQRSSLSEQSSGTGFFTEMDGSSKDDRFER